MAILRSMLDKEQRKELARHQRFHVIGSLGNEYCIRMDGYSGNITIDHEFGRTWLCAHCNHPVSTPEHWLAQMLLIRNNERKFLRTAHYYDGSQLPLRLQNIIYGP